MSNVAHNFPISCDTEPLCTEEAAHKVTITLVRTLTRGEAEGMTATETLLYSQQGREGRRTVIKAA